MNKTSIARFFMGGCKMQKNEYIKAKCVDYTHDGLGIVKHEGLPVFVKNMLIDEVGKVKIIKVLKRYAVGRLIELEQSSPFRQEARCPLFSNVEDVIYSILVHWHNNSLKPKECKIP